MSDNLKSVCFTGHRQIKNELQCKIDLKNLLCNLIENENVTSFYCGGAIG